MSGAEKGLIFNIIHGSFVDGYGIRTTIFLKGCPLRCVWCCNPEGQSFEADLKVSYNRCNGCGNCIGKCPESALTLRDGIIAVDRDKCTNCFQCIDVCYTDALDRFGTWYTVDEMFKIVAKDEKYYAATGGGLTIGGGEASWYPDFVMGLMEKCHEHGISVAIDTCGHVTDPKGLACLKQADLLLFDIKGLDPELHKRNTGQSNDVILSNLRMLNDLGKSIIIRLPIIPGYNDSKENLEQIADLLVSLQSVERVDILAIHEFGKIKYEQLGMPYKLESRDIPEEGKNALLEFFKSKGLNAQLGG